MIKKIATMEDIPDAGRLGRRLITLLLGGAPATGTGKSTLAKEYLLSPYQMRAVDIMMTEASTVAWQWSVGERLCTERALSGITGKTGLATIALAAFAATAAAADAAPRMACAAFEPSYADAGAAAATGPDSGGAQQCQSSYPTLAYSPARPCQQRSHRANIGQPAPRGPQPRYVAMWRRDSGDAAGIG